MNRKPPENATILPPSLHALFWEFDAGSLRLESDRDLIVRRILTRGRWADVQWLRRTLGDEAIRRWIVTTRGRPLDAPQLRFWQLVLDLPSPDVDAWLALPERAVWDGR